MANKKDPAAEYNTDLGAKEDAFQSWVKAQSARPEVNRDLSRDLYDYDLRGQYLDMTKAGDTQIKPGHGTDKGKKPNHPTFSDESQYSTPKQPGGHWGEDASGKTFYTPSPQMMADGYPEHESKEMKAYFKEAEPGVNLVKPPVDEWGAASARLMAAAGSGASRDELEIMATSLGLPASAATRAAALKAKK